MKMIVFNQVSLWVLTVSFSENFPWIEAIAYTVLTRLKAVAYAQFGENFGENEKFKH